MGKKLRIIGAAQNNLKNVSVDIPLGKFVCVTGVSGSGKSSLINEILYKYLASNLNGAKCRPGAFKQIKGIEALDKVIEINQAPIGRTPRSNPATYTGVFTDIRELYASTQDAKLRGFTSGRFSFNVKGGRCEACQGDGIIKIEMHFCRMSMSPCDVCKGKRYNRETLEIKYKGKSIYDVLEMTVEEGLEFFLQSSADCAQAPDPSGCRVGLCQDRPACYDSLRRRSTAREAGHRAEQTFHWTDHLYSR